MNAKEIRMYILDLQDQHCAACEHRTNQSPKYCLENCQVGEELYRLGKKLAPGVGQVRENPKRKNWEELMPKILEMLQKEIPMSVIAIEINCEVNTLQKQLKRMGLWHMPINLRLFITPKYKKTVFFLK
ncbi:zinc-finger domain-containing protein [Bacillus sp. FSL R12-0069]|uniref:zinc-finger domain-containing protein n=1 Tax=Bacillus sp. FSL R12-0069 TaxID=2975342 RepID=UPI0030FB5696